MWLRMGELYWDLMTMTLDSQRQDTGAIHVAMRAARIQCMCLLKTECGLETDDQNQSSWPTHLTRGCGSTAPLPP